MPLVCVLFVSKTLEELSKPWNFIAMLSVYLFVSVDIQFFYQGGSEEHAKPVSGHLAL
jgi:hypothetical protein